MPEQELVERLEGQPPGQQELEVDQRLGQEELGPALVQLLEQEPR